MIKQAIIPLAGLGTRLLPLTSVFPKELLPINGKPGLEYVLDDAKVDAASSSETTTPELGEKDTSSTSSTVSDVSSKATYEESAAGTVVLTKPERKNYTGRSGQARYEQAMIMYNNQKDMLKSYQKTQVKASLPKI